MKSARAEKANKDNSKAMERKRMTTVPRLRRVLMAHCGTHNLPRCTCRCVGRMTEGMSRQADPGVEARERCQDRAGDQHRDMAHREVRERTDGRADHE